MAVNINFIYDSARALWAKDKSGYFPISVFNNWAASAQVMLFEYYLNMKTENDKDTVNALEPFFIKQDIAFTNGIASQPTNLYKQSTWIYTWSRNTPTGIEVQPLPIIYKSLSEISEIYRNPLAKPSIIKKRLYWTYVNGDFQVYPTTIQKADLYYYRQPNAAIYSTTTLTTPNGTTQIYDPLTSVDFEWNQSEQENLLDLITFYAGLPLRESAIIDFVKAKQKEALVN